MWIFSIVFSAAPMDGLSLPSDYSQVYSILIKGSVAGTERITETSDQKGNLVSTSEHDMVISDGMENKRMAFATELVLSTDTFVPVRYSYKYTLGGSGDSYSLTVKDNQITRTLHRGGRVSEVTAPLQPDMVIVDFNVYYQYDYLVRKYDMKKAGRQSFPNFVPLIGSDVPLAITFQGESNLEYQKGHIAVRNFMIEFVGLWTGSLSVDKEGRLVRLLIPEQDLEVVRQDLLPEADEQ